MKIFMLAGDFNTGVSGETSDISSKLMTVVAGKPFLEWQLLMIKVQGFSEVVLCVGNDADKITDYFGDGSKLGLKIDYSITSEPLGTAGALRNASSSFADGIFLVMHGDTFIDVDYLGLLEFHDEKEAMLSMALANTGDASRYGAVRLDIGSRITGFASEQPDDTTYGYVNAGFYIIEPSIVNSIAPDQFVSLEHDVIPNLVAEKQAFGYTSDGNIIDVDTPEQIERAQKYFAHFS